MLFFYFIVRCCILPEFSTCDQRIKRDRAERMARPQAGQTQAMSGIDRHSEPQQHKTAAEYRQAADEHVRTLKDFWKDFLVSGLFVLAAIVAIFACLAWFAANNRVSATGSTIGAKAERYIITTDTTGTKGVYDDGTGTTFNIADSMDVSESSNFNNKAAGYLAPGASGSITFYVQWLDDSPEDLDVDITRSIIATTADLNASAEDFKNLLSGHILFFKNKDDDGYYSNWVGSTYTVAADEFNKAENKKVKCKLFWVWPEQFRSYVVPGYLNYTRGLFKSSDNADDTGYSKLLEHINEKQAWYFKSDGYIPKVSLGMPAADLQTCSLAYNEADEYLGNSVDKYQIRLTATARSEKKTSNTEGAK